VNLIKDPIFSSVLYSLQLSQYINLKKKARIIVPNSCVLIGVIDDQNILKDNEVFVQVRKGCFYKKQRTEDTNVDCFDNLDSLDENQESSNILEGDVIVTRFPCTHPGDVRILTAVNRPEL
jgi:RNA-dependent RNA polymerase